MRSRCTTLSLSLILLPFAFLAGGCVASRSPVEDVARSWLDFLENEGVGEDAILREFSYAGYDYSESPIPFREGPVFRVGDYGAVPDDGKADVDAIQEAIDAAGERGGGVVLFEPGRYLMNTLSGEEDLLRVASSNIVLRGAGSEPAGTELHWPRQLPPEDPGKMYSTPFMSYIAPKSVKESRLTGVGSGAVKGAFEIEVEDVSGIAEGDWVTLRLSDPKAIGLFFGDRLPRKEWTRSWTEGVQVAERHQVVGIEGARLRFREPLQVDVDSSHDWEVRTYPAIEEVGIEGMRLAGGWKGDFVHHRSALDDGGWSGLYLRNVRNGWIRDVVFSDWNYVLKLNGCSAFSVLRTRMVGTPGHHGLHARAGYGVLVGLSSDEAGHFHGPSVGYQSANTVFWNYDYSSRSSFDAHSTFPYATLLDSCSGGWRYGRSGGPMAGMPNHMRGLVVWNFERTGGDEPAFDFWRKGGFDDRDLFLKPVFVGFHGVDTRFNDEHMGWVESLVEPVEPRSLFEAQLRRRLGEMPAFLEAEQRLWSERNGLLVDRLR